MKILNTFLAASALALTAGAGNAATVDSFLGAEALGSSGDLSERVALADILGLDLTAEEVDEQFDLYEKLGSPYGLSFVDNVWQIDLGENSAPDYFVIKTGDLDLDPDYRHFFYANDGVDESKLVWSNDFSVCTGTFSSAVECAAAQGKISVLMWDAFLTAGDNPEKLSHISLINGPSVPCGDDCGPAIVPLPAAGWLLLGGLGGLAALRRRKKA